VVWTLPLEVEMYVLLPCLFAFYSRVRAIWPLLFGWLFACGVLFNISQGVSFLTSIPNFLPGVIAYAGYAKLRPRLSPWLLPPFLAATVLLVMYHMSVRRGWLFSLALGIALPLFQPFSSSIFTRICHEVAKYSFGIYLAHPFALWIGCDLLPGGPLAVRLAVIVATIAVLSVSSYHFLEAPMIRMGSRVAARLETRPIFGDRERSLV
jgi:peptidoglycan/LPS O-acetylase OafA/YrhL